MILYIKYNQEKHIESLKQAIRNKGNPLKVAQTRLEARSHRPDVELCRDPPHHRLVEEVDKYQVLIIISTVDKYIKVGQIQESIDLLNRKLNEAEMAHQVRLTFTSRHCF